MSFHPIEHPENQDMLRHIGLHEGQYEAWRAEGLLRDDGGQLCRLVRVERDHLGLHDGQQDITARALPALLAWLDTQGDALAVGDWVLMRRNVLGEPWVHERLPPRNQLARRLHDGREEITRAVIVSHVDTAFIVMGLDLDFNLARLARYLALVGMNGVPGVVVLTKADLCADAPARTQAVQAVLPPTAAAVAVNATDHDAAQALQPWLAPGQTVVLLGSSGAGKSTLTNTLCGQAVQATGGVRTGDGRGRHTTTARSLHRCAAGACIIDTPGLRTLRLEADAQRLDAVYDDVAALQVQCRFRDCRHEQEPGCAVRETLDAARLRDYQRLKREAERDTASLLARQQRLARWKAQAREARSRLAAKRGT